MEARLSGPQICYLLHRAAWGVAAEERRLIHENYGMGRSDFHVLETLLIRGPLPVSAIGRKVLLTSGSITTAGVRLEKRGFVGRSRNPNDRRISVIELTRIGRETIEAADVRHAEMLENQISRLSDAEKSQLAKLLQKLVEKR